jgi:hypothetical protein
MIVNDCEDPADTLKGDDGFVVAPIGNPKMTTDTVPANPFDGVTDTDADPLAPPSTAVSDAGATEMLKSAAGDCDPPPPPPHAARAQLNAHAHIPDMRRDCGWIKCAIAAICTFPAVSN